MEELVFTKAAVLSLLAQIDELSDLPISIVDTIDGQVQIHIGDSIYEIINEAAESIELDSDDVELVESVNEDAYNELLNSGEFTATNEIIESGIIKEAIKTLAVGGLVRLTNKLLSR